MLQYKQKDESKLIGFKEVKPYASMVMLKLPVLTFF